MFRMQEERQERYEINEWKKRKLRGKKRKGIHGRTRGKKENREMEEDEERTVSLGQDKEEEEEVRCKGKGRELLDGVQENDKEEKLRRGRKRKNERK